MAVTASPNVSSTVGLKNMVIAPLTADTEAAITYVRYRQWRAQSRRPLPPKTLIRT